MQTDEHDNAGVEEFEWGQTTKKSPVCKLKPNPNLRIGNARDFNSYADALFGADTKFFKPEEHIGRTLDIVVNETYHSDVIAYLKRLDAICEKVYMEKYKSKKGAWWSPVLTPMQGCSNSYLLSVKLAVNGFKTRINAVRKNGKMGRPVSSEIPRGSCVVMVANVTSIYVFGMRGGLTIYARNVGVRAPTDLQLANESAAALGLDPVDELEDDESMDGTDDFAEGFNHA